MTTKVEINSNSRTIEIDDNERLRFWMDISFFTFLTLFSISYLILETQVTPNLAFILYVLLAILSVMKVVIKLFFRSYHRKIDFSRINYILRKDYFSLEWYYVKLSNGRLRRIPNFTFDSEAREFEKILVKNDLQLKIKKTFANKK